VRERVVILGGGGHAKVVADILEEMAQFEIAGYFAPEATPGGLFDYPWLGTDAAIENRSEPVFVAIGDNRRRMDCLDSLKQRGFRLINALSPVAVISRRAGLGEGIVVMPGAVINAGTRVGDGAIINTNASLDHDCTIGTCAHIAPGVALAGCVSVGEGAFLGVGSSVVPGVKIGPWTTIGAGGVVVADLPGGVLALGVPAKIRRQTGE
jgi:sugar O-acyltransferase (sialic acid O-acetyltransferase NeuD family)